MRKRENVFVKERQDERERQSSLLHGLTAVKKRGRKQEANQQDTTVHVSCTRRKHGCKHAETLMLQHITELKGNLK